MKYYIYINEILQFESKLPAGYLISKKIEEKDIAFIELNKDQTLFYINNPTANVDEIWKMQLNNEESLSLEMLNQTPEPLFDPPIDSLLNGYMDKISEIEEAQTQAEKFNK